jgi:pimeloyl-ACP methyl ester carboxylesterase
VPVLYFHTLAGSHLELAVHNPTLQRHGIRLIAVDRPGYGSSDYVDCTAYEAFTRDLRVLLDHLRLRRVGLLACSAGIPHALSFAARLPERVSLVQCAGCIPPIEHVFTCPSPARRQRAQAYLFRLVPGLMRPAAELLLRRQTAESMARLMLGEASKAYQYDDLDVAFISHPAHWDYFVASLITALRQGTKAWAKEITMANQPWGIPFERTQCPVYLWHGSADKVFPVEMIESFASEFPDHRVTTLEGETHLLVHRQLDRILPAFHEFA